MNNCKNCGAPIHNGKCEYCGTEYSERLNIVHVTTTAKWVLTIRYREAVTNDPINSEWAYRLGFKCSNCGENLGIVRTVPESAYRYYDNEFFNALIREIKHRLKQYDMRFCPKCAARMTGVHIPTGQIPAAYGYAGIFSQILEHTDWSDITE
jgi:hypothetical protein